MAGGTTFKHRNWIQHPKKNKNMHFLLTHLLSLAFLIIS